MSRAVGFGLLVFWSEIFSTVFIRDIGPKFPFLVVSASGFGIRVMLASQSEFGSVPSSLIFLEEFEKDGY